MFIGFVYRHQTRVEVTDGDKHSSLLQYRIMTVKCFVIKVFLHLYSTIV